MLHEYDSNITMAKRECFEKENSSDKILDTNINVERKREREMNDKQQNWLLIYLITLNLNICRLCTWANSNASSTNNLLTFAASNRLNKVNEMFAIIRQQLC